jgi:hypothetical protein
MSTTKYEGRVSKVYTSRYGGSFGLESHQGLYFNTKQALPPWLAAGSGVSFEATMGRNGKSVYVTDATLVEVKQQPAPAGQSGGFIDRDASIRYQSSRKDALSMVSLLVQTNALWNPDKRPVQSKIAGIIESAVDRFTAIYFEDIETLGALDRTPLPEPEPAQVRTKAKPVEEADEELEE